MPRLPLAIVSAAALLASACTWHAASAQSLFEALAAGARQIADSGDLASTAPSPILTGLTHTALLVADSATHSAPRSPMLQPQRNDAHHDAYAAALEHKLAAATPLGAALDAIAARAAPEAAEAPLPSIAAVSPEPIANVADGVATEPAAEAERLPADTLAAGEMEPTSAFAVAADGAPAAVRSAAEAASVAAVADEIPVAASSAARSEMAETDAETVITAQDADATETVTADATANDPSASASTVQEPVSIFDIGAGAQALAQIASAEALPAAPAPDSAAPAPAAQDVPAEPARRATDERIVVAAVDPGMIETLEDEEGEQIRARTVERNPARTRPASVRRASKADPTPARKLKTQHAQAAAERPQIEERMPVEIRRPPRGLFQFQ